MSDETLALIERIGRLEGENSRLLKENAYLAERLAVAREQAQANWECVESVSIGERPECPKCHKARPCLCMDVG